MITHSLILQTFLRHTLGARYHVGPEAWKWRCPGLIAPTVLEFRRHISISNMYAEFSGEWVAIKASGADDV